MLDTPFIDLGPDTPFGDEPDEQPIITATVAPAAYAYSDGDTLNDHPDFATLDSTGNYASTEGAISSVQWLVDGVDQPGTYVLSAGQSVALRATDSPANTRDWTIDAAVAAIAPAISGIPAIAGTEENGQTLTATAASVTGSPTPTRAWQWERSGVAISGATSNTYTLTGDDVGETITVVQTETNVGGSDTAESAATGVIAEASAFDPATLFASGEDGAWYEVSPTYCWTDTGMTTNATVGDAVAAITDRSGNGYHGLQATVSRRPVLRQAVSGNYYLEFDDVDGDGFLLGTFARPADMWEVYGLDTNGDTVGVLWKVGSLYASTFGSGSASPVSSGAGTFAALYVDGVSETVGNRGDLYTSINGTHVSVFNYTGGSASTTQSLGEYPGGFQLGVHLYGMVWRDQMTAGERGDLETWMAGVTG